MEVIKDIKINNYKGIEEVQFPCGSINIIIGPNNTGKSSILESVLMSITSLNHFQDALKVELSDYLDLDNIKIKYFIHQEKSKSTIEVKLFDDNIINFELLYTEKGYPQEVADDFLKFVNKFSSNETLDSMYKYSRKKGSPFNDLVREIRFLESSLEELRDVEPRKMELEKILKSMSEKLEYAIEEYRNELIKSEKLFLVSKLNHNLISMHITMDEYIGEIPVLIPALINDKTIYNIPLIINSPRIDYDISELNDKLINTKKLGNVLESLKSRIPYFEDIREEEGDLVVLLKNLKESLPLYFMGDGFKALLKVVYMASLVKNGIVLFEEPETSMHPAYMDILAREIIFNSDDAQFFISTHSLELLERILQKAKKVDKLESVKILKLRRLPEGFIEREILSGREAKEEIESIKTDLRGY